ncbi:phage holin family protein [Dermatophilaceae bacterium Soc4.6]
MSTDQQTVPGNDRTEPNQRSIGQLVAQTTQDLRSLVAQEIALAKLEVTDGLAHLKTGAPLLAVAGFFALFALGFLLTAAAWALALVVETWLAFLIVAVALLLVAGIAAALGIRALKQVNPKPEKAIAGVGQTVEALKSAQRSGVEHAAALPPSRSEVALQPRNGAGGA